MTNIIPVRRRLKDDLTDHLTDTDTLDAWWRDFGNDDLRKVFEGIGMEAFRRSSCLDGFNQFVKSTGFRGERCIEFGTCKGLTAIVLSRYFDSVISIDIVPDDSREEIAEYLGIKNIEFHTITKNAEKKAILNDIDWKFDGAYCDANHAYDAQTDFDLVKKCGRVMFHEYWPLQPTVWELVNGLRDTGTVQSHSNFALWTAA